VDIICKKHGVFNQPPIEHLNGRGCPICKTSKGELVIKKWLDGNDIEYYHQHKFSDCKNKLPLPFDFYLPNDNTCIEYNGRQHYEPIWGEKDLGRVNLTDNIKKSYCEKNKIKLITIRYDDDIISKIVFLIKKI
jgi:hypothetical protein